MKKLALVLLAITLAGCASDDIVWTLDLLTWGDDEPETGTLVIDGKTYDVQSAD